MGGWLKNAARRERRDNANTYTDSDAQGLIDKIEKMETYSKEPATFDTLLRARDQAVIAVGWTFGIRGGEILSIRMMDVTFSQGQLTISLHVQKKAKTYRLCGCTAPPVKNAGKAKYCKECGSRLTGEPQRVQGETNRYSISKSLEYPFSKYIERWHKMARALGAKPSYYLFPRLSHFAQGFYWKKPMTVQWLNKMLQRLDPTMTSHFNRYGFIEKQLRLGYRSSEVKEQVHVSSERLIDTYAAKKGLTKAQKEFAEDVRLLNE